MAFSYNMQHGEFDLIVCDEVILIKASGPWNLECVEQFGQAYATAIAQSGLTSWAEITLLHGESLLVPDAEKGLRDRLFLAAAKGLKNIFLIIEESSVVMSCRKQFDNVYNGLPLHQQFEESFTSAVKAAQEAGFKVSLQEATAFFAKNTG